MAHNLRMKTFETIALIALTAAFQNTINLQQSVIPQEIPEITLRTTITVKLVVIGYPNWQIAVIASEMAMTSWILNFDSINPATTDPVANPMAEPERIAEISLKVHDASTLKSTKDTPLIADWYPMTI